jgi:hypothetical protein
LAMDKGNLDCWDDVVSCLVGPAAANAAFGN